MNSGIRKSSEQQSQRYEADSHDLDANILMQKGFSKTNINIDHPTASKQEMIAWGIDGYFGYLEPQEGYIDTLSMPIDGFSPEFQKRRDAVMNAIAKNPVFNSQNIQSASIDNGFLIIQTPEKRETINITQLWNEALFAEDKKQTLAESRQKQSELQENISREAFFNNSMVAEMTTGTVLTAGAGVVGLKSIRPIGNLAKDIVHVLKSIVIKDPDTGKYTRVKFDPPFVAQSKEVLRKNMQKIASSAGYAIDATGKIFSPSYRTLKKSSEQIAKMSFEEYQKSPLYDKKVTKKTFDKYKPKIVKQLTDTANDVASGKVPHTKVNGVLKRNASIVGGLASAPLTFFEYNRQQNGASLMWDVGETVLAGKSLALMSRAPGLWGKVGAGVVLAGIVTLGVKREAWLGYTRKKWQLFDKSNYSDGRSAIGHLTGAGINEVLDGAHDLTGAGAKNSIDIGISRTEVNPFGKHLFTIPELTLWQKKVTLGTSPNEWVQMSAGRDMHQWNEHVDAYLPELTKEVYEVLGKYFRNQGKFGSESDIKEAGGKEQLLRQELQKVLKGGAESNMFDQEITHIINSIIAELPNLSEKTIPNSKINQVLMYAVEAMKIDEFFLPKHEERAKQNIGQLLLDAQQNWGITPEQFAYIRKIPERMIQNKELWENDAEKQMYKNLIDDDRKIKIRNDEIELGASFAQFLEATAMEKEKIYFINQIKKGNGRGFDWNYLSLT